MTHMQKHRLTAYWQRGFTLIEVMIALVITGMLISILVSALYYMSRVQESIHNEIVFREADLKKRAWLSGVLMNCLPVTTEIGMQFSGAATRIECETTAPLSPTARGGSAIAILSIEKTSSGHSRLTYAEGKNGNNPAPSPYALYEWPAGEARFLFFNGRGEKFEKWPAEEKQPELLPGFVKLEINGQTGEPEVWQFSMRNTPWLEALPINPFATVF